jgi:ABC-type glycerol-3-phosphate transport system permease component
VAAVVLALAPGYLMLTGAFKTQEQFLADPWGLPLDPSLAGIRTALADDLPLWFANTLLVTGASVAGVMILASLAAWGFAHWDFRGRDTLLGVVVSLMVVPPVVLLVPLFQVGAELDLVSTFQLVILVYVGLMLPFSIYLLANFFRSVPSSLLEAAQLDGAGPMTTFLQVVLPLSRAPLATLTVVNMLWAWNELLLALVLLQDNDRRTLMAGLTGFQGRFSLDVPALMAGMTLVTLPLVVAYVLGQRFFVAGLTAGGVKGE